MALIVTAPDTYLAERRYSLDVVLSEWLGLDYRLVLAEGRRVVIRLADDPNGAALTLPDVLFATSRADWLTERSMPALPLGRFDPHRLPTAPDGPATMASRTSREQLPILFGEPHAVERVIDRTPTGLALALDVFGSAFFCLTRYEELVRPVRDAHGRFPASASLSAAEGFLERPLVDEYVDVLWAAMHALWPDLTRRPSSFRLRLTHDVDGPWASLALRSVGADLLRRHDPLLAMRRIRSAVDLRTGRVDRDPYNTFDFLMETSERVGIRSVFYFMAGNGASGGDCRYRLSDPPIAALLRRIRERGHEIGLHASYGSYRSVRQTKAEAEALRDTCAALGINQPEYGVRQHYLRFENPQTWRNQEAAGLAHDSTLAFADRVGFRAGTGREYPLFDLLDHRPLDVRERPLLAMDITLLAYMGLSLAEAAARTTAIVEASRRHNGDAVLLFHNDSLARRVARDGYRELVQRLASLT